MNKYVKPAFMLTSLSTGAIVNANCSIKNEDKELIKEVLDIDGSFALEENCDMPVNMSSFLQVYCKFTAGELGAAQALFS